MKSRFAAILTLASILSLGGAVRAGTIATAEGLASGTSGVTVDNSVVTAVLSAPGTVNGKSYSSYAVQVNDGTGAMFLFGSTLGGYTPVVGDNISSTGTYSPFHQIPELTPITSTTVNSSGNALPSIGTSNIPTLNQPTLPEDVAGYLWEVDNVTISGISGTFGIANLTGSISDGSNSMTLFYWPTSYSVENANLFGQTIPSGPVNMVGFVSVFTSGSTNTPEFTPFTITPAPEPASLAVVACGGFALLARRRRVAK